MTVEEIIMYILQSPNNTNPNVLRQILKAYQIADSDEIIEQDCEELLNRTYGTSST